MGIKSIISQKVKQMPDWENPGYEMDENISNAVKKFAELFYVTIARDRSLDTIPGTETPVQKEKPKRRKRELKFTADFLLMFALVFGYI